MTNPTPGSPITWRVTGSIEGLGPSPQGGYVRGVTATWRASNGTSGEVFLTAANFTPENVTAAVSEAVKAHAAALGLSGSVG